MTPSTASCGGAAAQRQALSGLGLGLFSLVLGLLLLAAGLLWRDLTRDLPAPEDLAALLEPPNSLLLQPTRLTDRSGETVLAVLAPPGQPRQYLPLYNPSGPRLPESLVEATLAVSDPGFWQHNGAVWEGLSNPQAHPTLAQQLVADFLLWDEPPGWRRAVRERLLAQEITARYGREQVLEWYLNHAYYGRLAVGAESAARLYLGKSAASLTPAEAALLAPLTETPSLTPYDAPQAAYQRQQETLALMRALGWLDEAAWQQARNRPLTLATAPPPPENSLLTAAVLAQAEAFIPRTRLLRGGVVIRTTIDAELQAQTACLLQAIRTPQPCPGAPSLPFQQGYPLQTQALILDVPSGEVLALASSSPNLPALHPAGSSLWPLVYLSGLTRGLNPSSLVWDVPAEQTLDWDNRFHGPERLRVALVNDDQAPLQQVLAQSGAYSLNQALAAHGLEQISPQELLSGEQPVHLLTLAQVYGIWAGGGLRIGQPLPAEGIQPALVAEIQEASNGRLLLHRESPQRTPALSPQLAYLMTDMLADPTVRRTDSRHLLDLGAPIAVKLASVSGRESAWAIGYTPDRLAALWLGAEEPLDDALPAGIWQTLMRTAQSGQPITPWAEPPGLSRLTVCDPSGQLPTEYCPQTVREVFLSGNEPIQADNLYQPYVINRETGLLATVFTPPDLVETRVYLNVPAEARAWAEANGWEMPPQTYDALEPPPRDPHAAIAAPDLFAYVRGQVAIQGTAAGPDFAWYALHTGQGLNPSRWEAIGARGLQAVENGRLGLWDTRNLEDGLYALRLQVVRQDDSLSTALTLVTVDNTPPQLRLRAPQDGARLSADEGQALLIRTEVTDNLRLDSLVFYLDGKRIAQRSEPPWAALTRVSPGSHTLRLQARDAAGNTTTVESQFEVQP